MDKGFYFGYGEENFGEERALNTNFKINLSKVEGAGVAFRKFREFQDSPKHATICVTCLNSNDVTIRVEKKLFNKVISEKHVIPGLTTKRIQLDLNQEECETLNEIVVAVLREDNSLKRVKIEVSAIIKE